MEDVKIRQYAVNDMFWTLQGEGARAGSSTAFLRFAGCNFWNGTKEGRAKGEGLCAQWCDTNFVKGIPATIESILEKLESLNPSFSDQGLKEKWVTITGGEPLLQLDESLIDALHGAGWKIAIETNGSKSALRCGRTVETAGIDWICVSPKKVKEGSALTWQLKKGNELKLILPGTQIGKESSGWTSEEVEEMEAMSFDHFFVQPQDPTHLGEVETTYLHPGEGVSYGYLAKHYHTNVQACIRWVQQRPKWRLSLQQHKILGIP